MYHCLYFPQDLRDPLEQISDSKKQEEKEKAALQSNTERYENMMGQIWIEKCLMKSFCTIRTWSSVYPSGF